MCGTFPAREVCLFSQSLLPIIVTLGCTKVKATKSMTSRANSAEVPGKTESLNQSISERRENSRENTRN